MSMCSVDVNKCVEAYESVYNWMTLLWALGIECLFADSKASVLSSPPYNLRVIINSGNFNISKDYDEDQLCTTQTIV